jgi:hypothetical protein
MIPQYVTIVLRDARVGVCLTDAGGGSPSVLIRAKGLEISDHVCFSGSPESLRSLAEAILAAVQDIPAALSGVTPLPWRMVETGLFVAESRINWPYQHG